MRSQGAYFEGDWCIIVLCAMFLVSSSINVSNFHSVWLDTFWTDLVIYMVEYDSAIKKEHFTPCNSMDGPGKHANWD